MPLHQASVSGSFGWNASQETYNGADCVFCMDNCCLLAPRGTEEMDMTGEGGGADDDADDDEDYHEEEEAAWRSSSSQIIAKPICKWHRLTFGSVNSQIQAETGICG